MPEYDNPEDEAASQLFAVFGQSYEPYGGPIIEDPLEWQKRIDNAPASINMRGSSRFWRTVAELSGMNIWRNGAPELSQMIIELKEGLGLLLSVDAWEQEEGEEPGGWIDYRFIELDYSRPAWPVKKEAD